MNEWVNGWGLWWFCICSAAFLAGLHGVVAGSFGQEREVTVKNGGGTNEPRETSMLLVLVLGLVLVAGRWSRLLVSVKLGEGVPRRQG